MKSPTISVVMPVFNAEVYVGKAIESILNQTFTDFELIVVDDGSTDKTVDVVKKFKDKRIKILKNKKNLGIVASLNRGIKSAKGKYIARQDADDISLPKRLELQVEAFEKDKDLVLVGSNAVIIDKDGKELEKAELFTSPEQIFYHLHFGNRFYHTSVMFKKSVFGKVGGYRDKYPHAEDYDLWLRMMNNGRMINISEPLVKYRRVDGSISRDNEGVQKEMVARRIGEMFPGLKSNLDMQTIEALNEKGDANMFRLLKFLWRINGQIILEAEDNQYLSLNKVKIDALRKTFRLIRKNLL